MDYFGKSLNTVSTTKSCESKQALNKDRFNIKLKQDGIKFSVQRVVNLISNSFTSHKAAFQFVLEELDMSQDGSSIEKIFISNSGVKYDLYNNSTANYNQQNRALLMEVDNASMQLYCVLNMLNKPDSFKMEFKLAVIDKIMEKYKIGKYGLMESHETTITTS